MMPSSVCTISVTSPQVGDVLHGVDERARRREAAHRGGQRLDHFARGDAVLLGDGLDHRARIGGKRARQIRLDCCKLHQAALPLRCERLLHLEALELRVAEIERRRIAVIAGARMRAAELLRLGPGLEIRLAGPHGVRGIERVVLGLRALQQVEFDEARQLVEIAVAALPHALKGLFRALDHLEAVHGDEHGCLRKTSNRWQ